MFLIQNRWKFRAKYLTQWFSDYTTTVINTKIGEVKNTIPDGSGLVKKSVYDVKTPGIEKK